MPLPVHAESRLPIPRTATLHLRVEEDIPSAFLVAFSAPRVFKRSSACGVEATARTFLMSFGKAEQKLKLCIGWGGPPRTARLGEVTPLRR